MILLVCNAGSTSLKFKLFDMPAETVLAEAKVERIGRTDNGIFTYQNPQGAYVHAEKVDIPTYTEGIRMFLECLLNPAEPVGVLRDVKQIERIGFKTVLAPGYGVARIDQDVTEKMREFLDVAPAHNGPYLEAVEHFKKLLPDAIQVGVFETAYHSTIPKERYLYAVPYEWYEKYGFRRMCYHGASHSYVAETVAGLFGGTGKLISCHLGGSCSLCAIENGISMDSTFGLSLQNGVCHANRCGDIDVYVFPFLKNRGLSDEEILYGLEKNGGLLGISGVSNDMRELREAAAAGNERADLAIRHFVNGIVKYIGAFYAELGGLDTLVFTAGIGENDSELRREVCRQTAHLGIQLAKEAKDLGGGNLLLSAEDSPVRVLVIPANEELGVARKSYQWQP
ncbi:MAG: acetate/propionate family kinase [Lachnospiraceae bacterium]|nr:acetate/propionate family kinase [Lachnospiraceae bacterium]